MSQHGLDKITAGKFLLQPQFVRPEIIQEFPIRNDFNTVHESPFRFTAYDNAPVDGIVLLLKNYAEAFHLFLMDSGRRLDFNRHAFIENNIHFGAFYVAPEIDRHPGCKI